MHRKNDVLPWVLKRRDAAIYHASLSAARCESEAEDEKEKGGWGAVGTKTGLSETDCRLQRETIKLTKYHYQIFNKVAAIR